MKLFKAFKISILSTLLFVNYFAIGQQLETSIFITGNTGSAKDFSVLSQINSQSKTLDNSKLLLLGNVVSKEGFTEDSKTKVKSQLETLSSFNGNVIIAPGNNEWASEGYRGERDFSKFIKKNSEVKFYPGKKSPLKKSDLSENVALITIDSEWFLKDWNKQLYINQDSEIKNRTLFFLEFENLLKKSQGKIKIISIHHPVKTNTKQGLISNIGGVSKQDFQSKQYRALRKRITTIASQTDDVIFVSGNDKNIQYIASNHIPQIISGAAGDLEKVKNVDNKDFAEAKNGYARLDIDIHGKVEVHFFSTENNNSESIFSSTILKGGKEEKVISFKGKSTYGKTESSSIYSSEEVDKNGLYKTLWGKHYREFYGKEVNAPVVFLDTVMGGLTPLKRGGGQQSKSLRLVDKNGKQFVMRALRKSTTKFLQSNAFQDTYIGDALDGTVIDKFLSDFYTTSHPYTPFAIGGLADAVDVFHTNPKIYYIPKQEVLGVFNDEFGDELYMIEEHVGSTQIETKSFGTPKKILSTADVLQEINKSGKSVVDETSYIRARVFDMLIGDWDRHEDQWRWALFKKEDGTEICKPIPRDRDQAFSKYDGVLISFLTRAVPALRKMQTYGDDLRSAKWFASSPYHLDLTLVNNSDWDVWEAQTKKIQESLTDDVIEQAFEIIPNEIKGETIDDIKLKLKGRRENLMKIAKEYYAYLNKFEVVTGTQKADIFKIKRLPNGKTSIDIHRKDHGILNRTFSHDITKEIWVYGLDGKDTFIVEGKGDHLIDIKVIGGKKNDTYDFKNTKKVKLYDYKSKENTIVNKRSKKWLVDDYKINNYDHKKIKQNVNQLLPIIGFNPDDGLRLGFINTNTSYGLQRNPFTRKHIISASYYTGNSGYDISYKGEFSNIFHNWNFGIEGLYTSPNFAINYFGFGNETTYDKDDVELDFNRVRIREWNAAISLNWRGENGGHFQFKPLLESFEVENTEERFINDALAPTSTAFEKQTYSGAEVTYQFVNKNNPSFPTLGLDTSLKAGYKTNIDNSDADNSFAYLKPQIIVDHKLNSSGSLVLATKLSGEFIFGDDFEFYHAAQIGGNDGLRGFRNERFTGKSSYYQNTDLRVLLGGLKTSVIPIKFGVTGSFDYGRVWEEDDNSDKWHNNVGGSLWISGAEALTANLGYFNSTDGGRIVFVLGFAF